MKTMFKRTLAFLLCALLLCTVLPFVATAAEVLFGECGKDGDNVTWTLDLNTGALTISGTGEMDNFNIFDIYTPWTDNLRRIQSVTIENGVTTIGDYAFSGCSNLTNVTISDSVTQIGDGSFALCDRLTDLTIPDSVTSIGVNAFYAGKMTSITIPKNVVSIGGHAFIHCTRLTSFIVDEQNPVYSSDASGMLFNKEKTTLICYPAGNPQTAYTIPNSVTSIGKSAFWDSNLTNVTIPDSVTSIGDCAFAECFYLANVTLPDGVTVISESSFVYCKNLSWIHIPKSVKVIRDSAFAECINLAYICSDTSNCYAKTYAEENGVEFRVCDGNHTQDTQPVQVEFDDDAFDVPVRLYVQEIACSELEHEFPQYEFSMTGAKVIYLIRTVDENGNVVQPKAGHPVTLYIPVPALCNAEKCYISHVLDDQGHSESFKLNPKAGSKTKPFTVSADGKCFILEVTSFSPFIVFEEQPVSLKLRDTKKTLPFGEKRTLTLDVENLPDGAKIVWTADCDRVELEPSDDGRTCEISAKKNGKVTVTATVVDADGYPIEQDGAAAFVSVTLQTKAGFFHKLFYWIFRTPWPFG